MQFELPLPDFSAIQSADALKAAIIGWYMAVIGWMRTSGFGKVLMVKQMTAGYTSVAASLGVLAWTLFSPLILTGRLAKWLVVGKMEIPTFKDEPKANAYPYALRDMIASLESRVNAWDRLDTTREEQINNLQVANRELQQQWVNTQSKANRIEQDQLALVATIGALEKNDLKSFLDKFTQLEKALSGYSGRLATTEQSLLALATDQEKIKGNVTSLTNRADTIINRLQDRVTQLEAGTIRTDTRLAGLDLSVKGMPTDKEIKTLMESTKGQADKVNKLTEEIKGLQKAIVDGQKLVKDSGLLGGDFPGKLVVAPAGVKIEPLSPAIKPSEWVKGSEFIPELGSKVQVYNFGTIGDPLRGITDCVATVIPDEQKREGHCLNPKDHLLAFPSYIWRYVDGRPTPTKPLIGAGWTALTEKKPTKEDLEDYGNGSEFKKSGGYLKVLLTDGTEKKAFYQINVDKYVAEGGGYWPEAETKGTLLQPTHWKKSNA